MKASLLVLLFYSTCLLAQPADTLAGFATKVAGEEISYFSPLHQFARTALLTRVNGEMPIRWTSPAYKGTKDLVTYELLLGHSTGTSSAERHFEVKLGETSLFTIATPMKMKGNYVLSGEGAEKSSWYFKQEEYDANRDAFGKLYISLPAALARNSPLFSIRGLNENSRYWLMIFMYQPGFKGIAEPTCLVTRAENRRQLNLFFDNPYRGEKSLFIKTRDRQYTVQLQKGYNAIRLPAYNPEMTGYDTIECRLEGSDSLALPVQLFKIRDFVFTIIHHSHNDIGYSHIQPEVEQIQNRNIRSALKWISDNRAATEKPVWHIESLWAVENFLRVAAKNEEAAFIDAVKKGQLVLSANYANILTGLCQPEELNWVLEYAKQLEIKYGFKIRNGMITDIPGITRSGLLSYINNDIPYLSLGPNYVETHPDQGDRVGSVIREQGDQAFYWKPDSRSAKRLLVWTAGKGYSFFHGIPDS